MTPSITLLTPQTAPLIIPLNIELMPSLTACHPPDKLDPIDEPKPFAFSMILSKVLPLSSPSLDHHFPALDHAVLAPLPTLSDMSPHFSEVHFLTLSQVSEVFLEISPHFVETLVPIESAVSLTDFLALSHFSEVHFLTLSHASPVAFLIPSHFSPIHEPSLPAASIMESQFL